MTRIKGTFSALLLVLLSPLASQASTITVGTLETNDCTYPCMTTLQQIYDSSYFGSDAIDITSIGNYANGGTFSGTYDVYVSTAAVDYTAITTNFASNRGADWALFGSVDLAGSWAFNDLISAGGSFLYDPNAGDLLVEWVLSSGTSGGGFRGGYADFSRAYEWKNTGSKFAGAGYAIATEFEYAAAVPEPGTLALLGIGLFGMGMVTRKKA